MRSELSTQKAIPDSPSASDARSQGTLTKQEIAHAVYFAHPGVSRRQAKELIDAVLEEIVSALVGGEDVNRRNFGRFAVREKRERTGRNPKTGVAAPIAARSVVTFKASESLKAQVDGQ